MLKIHKIVARDLPDLWFLAIHDLLEIGREFKIDHGSYVGQTRIEYDYFIGHVLNPYYGSGTPEILPHIPAHLGIPDPVDFDFIYGGGKYKKSYIEYLMSPNKEEGESYTYGSRLCQAWSLEYGLFDQIEHIIKIYKQYGHRNNQMVLHIGDAVDLMLKDPACLQHIDTRIQDNKLHFFIYFRSWDLFSGMPANLAAIEALQQYMAGEIGVEQGEFIVESKGAHIYGYCEELVKLRCMKGT